MIDFACVIVLVAIFGLPALGVLMEITVSILNVIGAVLSWLKII